MSAHSNNPPLHVGDFNDDSGLLIRTQQQKYQAPSLTGNGKHNMMPYPVRPTPVMNANPAVNDPSLQIQSSLNTAAAAAAAFALYGSFFQHTQQQHHQLLAQTKQSSSSSNDLK